MAALLREAGVGKVGITGLATDFWYGHIPFCVALQHQKDTPGEVIAVVQVLTSRRWI